MENITVGLFSSPEKRDLYHVHRADQWHSEMAEHFRGKAQDKENHTKAELRRFEAAVEQHERMGGR